MRGTGFLYGTKMGGFSRGGSAWTFLHPGSDLILSPRSGHMSVALAKRQCADMGMDVQARVSATKQTAPGQPVTLTIEFVGHRDIDVPEADVFTVVGETRTRKTDAEIAKVVYAKLQGV